MTSTEEQSKDYKDPSATLEEGMPLMENIHATATHWEGGVPLLPKSHTVQHDNPEATATASRYRLPTVSREELRQFARSAYNSERVSMFNKAHNDKVLFYDHDSLLTASALTHLGQSAFAQKPVLMTLLYCIVIATVSASILFFVPRASKFNTEKFQTVAVFLKFFISFMLGLYVQQAFKRWWGCVTAFEKFLISIRQLMFMIHTIRGTDEWRNLLEMYCVGSGYILNAELRNCQVVDDRKHVDMSGLMTWLSEKHFLSEDEVVQLGKTSNSVLSKTRAVWSWIGELVSHPEVEDGMAVAPPFLVRTITLCQTCIAEIENLKLNLVMQTPFMYAQLLSILVHINNTILALNCGLALGSSVNEIRRRGEQLEGDRTTGRSDLGVKSELYEAIQTVGVQMTILLITPMLYVAFLHIAHMLCYPFGDESYHLPTETFIARLHAELEQMSTNRKYFRARHENWKEAHRQVENDPDKA